MSLTKSDARHSNEHLGLEFGRQKAPAPRLGPHHSGPPARPTRPRAAPAARRALAGSARVSVEGAGTGEHHMPALPSKGKSRDLSVAALIPVSAYGVVKRLGSPDEEQHALLLFLSDSGNGGRAGSLGSHSSVRFANQSRVNSTVQVRSRSSVHLMGRPCRR